jgi:hypothetical protein
LIRQRPNVILVSFGGWKCFRNGSARGGPFIAIAKDRLQIGGLLLVRERGRISAEEAGRVKELERFRWEFCGPCKSAISAVFKQLVVNKIARMMVEGFSQDIPATAFYEVSSSFPTLISNHPAVTMDVLSNLFGSHRPWRNNRNSGINQ